MLQKNVSSPLKIPKNHIWQQSTLWWPHKMRNFGLFIVCELSMSKTDIKTIYWKLPLLISSLSFFYFFLNPSLSYPKASVARFLHYSCDKIFVTDLGLHKMYIVDLKTGEQAIHGNYGSNHGQFTKPTGLISDDRCSAIVVLCTK